MRPLCRRPCSAQGRPPGHGEKARLAVYHEQTEPLKAYYEKQGKLFSIDGQGDIAENYGADHRCGRGGEMIVIKTRRELEIMRLATRISARALRPRGEAVEPGVTTEGNRPPDPGAISRGRARRRPSSDTAASRQRLHFGKPCGDPRHTGPQDKAQAGRYRERGRPGPFFEGYHGDNAWTFPCGDISEKAQKLLKATEEPFTGALRWQRRGTG